ncbi:MAG: right-handed parallel beta-helix repeat-containing protein [Deltaproteobacteria bacterium]|nr:right-handed parallel beta-helix repeat-containing protein [Deltaproteobacteria bacterium]
MMTGIRFKAKVFFAVMLAMFLVSGGAMAATFCVGTASELQSALNTAAINQADDLIMIRQGTYTGNFSYVSYQPYDLGIGGGFTGAGGGCTARTADASNTVLDANGSGNVLYISTAHEVIIAIDAITMKNGNAGDGGGGLYVYALLADVSVSNTAITDNTGSAGGGAYVYAPDGTVTFTNNDISDNTAAWSSGGGVYVIAGVSTFDTNTIDNNTSDYNGGGVLLAEMTVYRNTTFIDNTITNNTAYYNGGGVYVEDGQALASSSVGAELIPVLTITGGTFHGNSASNNSGGGLYFNVSNGEGVITDVTFSDNTSDSGDGGGMYFVSGGDLTLTDNTFTSNSTGGDGGGAFIKNNDAVTLTGNTFTSNDAGNEGAGASIGSNNDAVTLTGNTFTGNTTTSGEGAAHIEYNNGVVTLTNNTFTSNSSANSNGGGTHIESNYDDVILTGNTFDSNTAGQWNEGGGADIRDNSGDVTLTDNTFTSNTAGSDGGGVCIENDSGVVTVTNNTFDSNTAGSDGGGASLRAYTGTATLVNNVITDNTAGNSGGGLVVYVTSGTATLTNNTITGNTATRGGGVVAYLYYDAGTANIYNNIIWGNNEPEVGALATNDGTDLYINNNGNGNGIASVVNLFNNDFDQSAEGFFATIAFTPDASNLDNADPLFFDAANNDYHLWGNPLTAPPVVDAGDDSAPQIPDLDKDGNDRIIGDAVDMGAYEFAGAAVPDLKVNGSDGPVTVSKGATLTITGQLTAGAYTGETIEVFASVATPLGTFWRTPTGWSATPAMFMETTLADIPATTLFSGPAAFVGAFTATLTIDATLDGIVSGDAVSDSVDITVTGPTRARK